MCCTFHGLGPLASSDLELISESITPLHIPVGLGQGIDQDNTTQKNADILPCLKQDSNQRSPVFELPKAIRGKDDIKRDNRTHFKYYFD